MHLYYSRPPGYNCLNFLFRDSFSKHALYILLITFSCYTCYHASRKPISVVKSVLHTGRFSDSHSPGWAPFHQTNWSHLIGGLEYVYLLVYAVSMVFSGYIAERADLRHFLSLGMLLSGLANVAFGIAYYMQIHTYTYFIVVQLVSGVVQASGWPAVVTLMGNWWGKKKRGLIMGLWNAHTSVGNIAGSLIAGYYVEQNWGSAFIAPGLILILAAMVVFFTLVSSPVSIPLFINGTATPSPQQGSAPPNRSSSEPCLLKRSSSNPDTLDAINLPVDTASKQAITFREALFVPNVIAYSILLFFAKLVSYTFLYWLPNYLALIEPGQVTPESAARLSVLFDLGGIVGGVLSGVLSDSKNQNEADADTIGRRAVTCAVMLAIAAPLLLLYQFVASGSSLVSLVLLFCCGIVVNGPYALITTAVSADLGTQRVLQGRARALATITAIIDGTGSFGAALGPFLTGILVPFGWSTVFYMLILSDICALLVACWIARHFYSVFKFKRFNLLQL